MSEKRSRGAVHCALATFFLINSGQIMVNFQRMIHRPKLVSWCKIQWSQGWKAEKNLRFLLQKVLKQSDVGNLGRIVLPKVSFHTMHLIVLSGSVFRAFCFTKS